MTKCDEEKRKLLERNDIKIFVMICLVCVMLNIYMTVDIVMNCLIIIGTFVLLKIPKEVWER